MCTQLIDLVETAVLADYLKFAFSRVNRSPARATFPRIGKAITRNRVERFRTPRHYNSGLHQQLAETQLNLPLIHIREATLSQAVDRRILFPTLNALECISICLPSNIGKGSEQH